jgi:hypothetical protein
MAALCGEPFSREATREVCDVIGRRVGLASNALTAIVRAITTAGSPAALRPLLDVAIRATSMLKPYSEATDLRRDEPSGSSCQQANPEVNAVVAELDHLLGSTAVGAVDAESGEWDRMIERAPYYVLVLYDELRRRDTSRLDLDELIEDHAGDGSAVDPQKLRRWSYYKLNQSDARVIESALALVSTPVADWSDALVAHPDWLTLPTINAVLDELLAHARNIQFVGAATTELLGWLHLAPVPVEVPDRARFLRAKLLLCRANAELEAQQHVAAETDAEIAEAILRDIRGCEANVADAISLRARICIATSRAREAISLLMSCVATYETSHETVALARTCLLLTDAYKQIGDSDGATTALNYAHLLAASDASGLISEMMVSQLSTIASSPVTDRAQVGELVSFRRSLQPEAVTNGESR